jgi:enamine deaminase RidA (YjgF/YER057c/UK114 family)
MDCFGVDVTGEPAPWGVPDWPVSVLGPGQDGSVGGIQALAIEGTELSPLQDRGRTVGTVFETGTARCCLLGSLIGDLSSTPADQAEQVFASMARVLETAGLRLEDLTRTWLYLDRILDWYDDLNRVRTRFFQRNRVFEGLVPASTGIGVDNGAGAAILAGGVAMRSLPDSSLTVQPVTSPLQCPALEYGSSFSRAVEVEAAGVHRLFVSGTASIAADGATAHVEDLEGQVSLTMQVVREILRSRDMDWRDVTRAIVYIKATAGRTVFEDFCREQELPPLPAVVLVSDVCRDDLLFEIEVDACRRTA